MNGINLQNFQTMLWLLHDITFSFLYSNILEFSF